MVAGMVSEKRQAFDNKKDCKVDENRQNQNIDNNDDRLCASAHNVLALKHCH